MKIGDILTYKTNGVNDMSYNGHDDHPCVITKVWSDTCVNVKVFFDCGPVEDKTSVPVKDDVCGYSLEG